MGFEGWQALILAIRNGLTFHDLRTSDTCLVQVLYERAIVAERH
jgi:hypothetical protein